MDPNQPTDPNQNLDLITAPKDDLIPQDQPEDLPQANQQDQTFTPPADWSGNNQQESTPTPTGVLSQISQTPQPETYPPSTPQSQTPQPSPKSSNHIRLFFVSLALILLGILVGVIAARFLPTQPIALVSPTPTISISPTISKNPNPIADDTANWQIYTNVKNNLSFKYPQEYFKYVHEETSGDSIYFAPFNGGGEEGGTPLSLTGNDVWLSIGISTAKAGQQDSPKELVSLKGPQPTSSYQATIVNNGKAIKVEMSSFLEETLTKHSTVFDQILSSFVFTGSPELSIKYPITYNSEKNLYLVFPKGVSIDKNVITLGNSSFLIRTSVGPGLCPMDSEGDSCTYTDQPGSKWGYYRVWTKSTLPFAINPQVITIEGVHSDGLIITKSTPNTYFSEAELNQWREIINSVEIGK